MIMHQLRKIGVAINYPWLDEDFRSEKNVENLRKSLIAHWELFVEQR